MLINLSELSPVDAVKTFCGLFRDEISFRESKGLDAEGIFSYYKGLFKNRTSLNALRVAGYARRIEPVVREIINHGGQPRVLDAGCGYGTESLLFYLLGAEVFGIELIPERFESAKSRPDFYQKYSRTSLPIRFINKNILHFLEESQDAFDIIWAMESISHIHPLEDFLRLAKNRLNQHGKIIVSDQNLISPVTFIRNFKIRRGVEEKVHHQFLDPDTGQPVDYAVEKIYSAKRFSNYLKMAGFRIKRVEMAGFMGSSFLPDFLLSNQMTIGLMTGINDILKSLPLIRQVGTIYTITAEKQ